jgi:M protein trans-acting positive regulator (MGA) HTH domain.
MYSWELKGDMLAYYLNQFGFDGLKKDNYKDLAELLGTSESSLKARIQNVRNVLDDSVGLSHAARQTKSIVPFLEGVKDVSKGQKEFKELLKDFLNDSL